ncbi:hypothetical protein RRG08_056654 [Elysia crispata]|uniref:Uncharacterized protein n=1 Tax=Elysia crispata TaxID=231223 RepID=A0AAE0YFX8_9GAST|nr:hypothetical protein RRG08_056654 [Elysia crispata]
MERKRSQGLEKLTSQPAFQDIQVNLSADCDQDTAWVVDARVSSSSHRPQTSISLGPVTHHMGRGQSLRPRVHIYHRAGLRLTGADLGLRSSIKMLTGHKSSDF